MISTVIFLVLAFSVFVSLAGCLGDILYYKKDKPLPNITMLPVVLLLATIVWVMYRSLSAIEKQFGP